MHKHWKAVAAASAVAVSAVAATALYADSRNEGHDTTMMGRGGMMGQGGMMDHCSQMMGGLGSGRPNEQWKKEPPKTPENKTPEKKS